MNPKHVPGRPGETRGNAKQTLDIPACGLLSALAVDSPPAAQGEQEGHLLPGLTPLTLHCLPWVDLSCRQTSYRTYPCLSSERIKSVSNTFPNRGLVLQWDSNFGSNC